MKYVRLFVIQGHENHFNQALYIFQTYAWWVQGKLGSGQLGQVSGAKNHLVLACHHGYLSILLPILKIMYLFGTIVSFQYQFSENFGCFCQRQKKAETVLAMAYNGHVRSGFTVSLICLYIF